MAAATVVVTVGVGLAAPGIASGAPLGPSRTSVPVVPDGRPTLVLAGTAPASPLPTVLLAPPAIGLGDYQLSKSAAISQAAYYDSIAQWTGLVPLPGHMGEAANATAQMISALANSLRAAAENPDAIAVGVHPDTNFAKVSVYPVFPLDGAPRKPDPTA